MIGAASAQAGVAIGDVLVRIVRTPSRVRCNSRVPCSRSHSESGAGASYGSVNNPDAPNIVNVAVPPHTDPATFKQLFSGIVETVAAFQPSILFISGAALSSQAASRKL